MKFKLIRINLLTGSKEVIKENATEQDFYNEKSTIQNAYPESVRLDECSYSACKEGHKLITKHGYEIQVENKWYAIELVVDDKF